MRFFTAFCNHWHCTCAMVLSLLCNPWQFLLGFSAMAKQNQNPKKQQTKKTKKTKHQKPKKQTKKTTTKNKMTKPNSLPLFPPWGCIFFLVSGSLLVFWRAKDLDLTLCQFSHFRGCKLAFGWFYYLLWACGSSRKQCKKTMAKCRYHWRKLRGLGTQIRQFCLFM